MGASKELFLSMRAEEMVSMYDSSFTKKEATETGKNLITKAIEDGNVGKHELMTTIARLKAVIDSAESELRKHLPTENASIMGVEFTTVNGGETLNLTECSIYCQLKKDLDDRVDLLKLAQKQDVIDTYGNDVPKVGTTPRKSSITIKF